MRFLADRLLHTKELDRLRESKKVVGHELVLRRTAQLAIGADAASSWLPTKMHQAVTVPHADVVSFVRYRNLHGCGIGWIGTPLLASALVEHLSLWTVDPRLAEVATDLGVAYQVPAV
jgi:hypothetical protein